MPNYVLMSFIFDRLNTGVEIMVRPKRVETGLATVYHQLFVKFRVVAVAN